MKKILPFKSREEKMLDAFIDQNREPALMIVPHKAGADCRMVSKFGGLPILSAQTEWPRDPKGRPLHFLAQIDCAELPWHGRLPETGILSFFGRDDEEQIWEDDVEEPTKNCAVLYDDPAFADRIVRQPPTDLEPIGNGLRGAANHKATWDGGECTPHKCKMHTERVIEFHRTPIMTIPESIYNGNAPLAEFGGIDYLVAHRDGRSSEAGKRLALEGRLSELLDEKRRELLQCVAKVVFQKDASSAEAHGNYSQMLGHPNTSQGTYPPVPNALCLLNISSDLVTNFSFGDAGFCTFWITETDLGHRDFSRVHGQIAGG